MWFSYSSIKLKKNETYIKECVVKPLNNQELKQIPYLCFKRVLR